MQAAEALTRVIAMSDELLALHPSQRPANDVEDKEKDPDHIAVAVSQAMLNMMMPVARFRAHVTVESIGTQTKLGLGDFTICGVDISSIKNGLVGLSMETVAVHATLWEQRATGADMLNGYQGSTKTLGFRNWLKSLDQFETSPTVN